MLGRAADSAFGAGAVQDAWVWCSSAPHGATAAANRCAALLDGTDGPREGEVRVCACSQVLYGLPAGSGAGGGVPLKTKQQGSAPGGALRGSALATAAQGLASTGQY